MIIRAAVSRDNFKKSTQILLKTVYNIPTNTTTNAMALKFFADIIQ